MEYELLEELAREINPEMTPDEVTAQMVADYTGISWSKARAILEGKVQSGLYLSRQVRLPNGHIAQAYKKRS